MIQPHQTITNHLPYFPPMPIVIQLVYNEKLKIKKDPKRCKKELSFFSENFKQKNEELFIHSALGQSKRKLHE